MTSLALEHLEENHPIEYDFRTVIPRTDIAEAPKPFLSHVLAGALIEYKDEIIKSEGRGVEHGIFPFHEFTFALFSIASGQAKFHSFPTQRCNSQTCDWWGCKSVHEVSWNKCRRLEGNQVSHSRCQEV